MTPRESGKRGPLQIIFLSYLGEGTERQADQILSIGCRRRNCSVVQDDGGLSGDALNILRSNTDSSCLQDGGKHPASESKKDKILLTAKSDVEEGVMDV